MAAWVAPAIGAASSLLGGFMNKGPSLSDQLKVMQRTEEKKYKWIVEGAQRAGFNPLTALQAGGGQMTQTQAGANDFDTGSMIAAAVLNGVGDYWNQRKDQELAEAQIDLIKAQTESLKTDQAPGAWGSRPVGGPVRDVSGDAAGSNAVAQELRPSILPATTQFDVVDQATIVDEAQEFRAKEEGVKNSYSGFRFPSYIPTGETVEGWFGDGGPATWAYQAVVTPMVVGDNLGRGAGSLVDSVRSKTQGQGPVMKMGDGERYQMQRFYPDQPRPQSGSTWTGLPLQ